MHKAGFVTLIGRPNSGKSTLMNQLLGEKLSIVSDKPQTTRDRILGILTLEAGQIVFVDTPGVHRPEHELNKRMMRAVHDSFEGADLLLVLVDASARFGSGDQYVLNLIKEKGLATILLLNKIDLLQKEKLLPLIDFYSQRYDFREIVPISALKKDNLDLLMHLILQYLPEGPELFPQDQLTDRPERFLVTEMVREKILLHTHEELPYSTTVRMVRYEDKGDVALIYCDIVVEKESQKKIVIGSQGQKLKAVGIDARHDIEKLTGKRVYLELNVKVRHQWRNDERFLDGLGIESSGNS